MKKSIFQFVATAALALIGLAASLSAQAQMPSQSLVSLNNEIQVYGGVHNVDYKEIDTFGVTGTGVLDAEKGNQSVIGIKLSKQHTVGLLKNYYVEGDFHQASGKTKYDGYLQNSQDTTLIPYTYNDVKFKFTDASLKSGLVFPFDHGQSQVIPYVSLGYHKWVRDSSSSPYGYREDYTHNEVAIGAKYQVLVTRKTALEVEGSVGSTFGAKMAVDGTTLDLGSKTVSNFGISLHTMYDSRLSVHYGVSRKAFDYGISPTVNGIVEPNSKTVSVLANVGIGYRF